MRTDGWRRVDLLALRRAALDPEALLPLIRSDPERAARLLSDLLIEEPQRFGPDGLREQIGIAELYETKRSSPTGTAFWPLFQHAPDHALTALLEVVDHATTTWQTGDGAEFAEFGIGQAFEIVTDAGPVALTGDETVMHWYRGDARMPDALAQALMALEKTLYDRLDAGQDVDELLDGMLASRSVAMYGLLVAVACYRPDLLAGPLAMLGTSVALVHADRLYKSRPHDELLWGIGPPGPDDQQWFDMPHRRRELSGCLLELALNGEGTVLDALAAGRRRWAAYGDRWRFLIAQHDPANFQITTVSTPGGDVAAFAFDMPEELRRETEGEAEQHDRTTWWLMAAHRLRRMLDDEQAPPLEAQEAEALWQEVLSSAEEGMPADLASEGLIAEPDVTCGAAAVLLLRAGGWVAGHPEARRWCVEVLLAAFQAPPAVRAFDLPDAIGDDQWDHFAADALPGLWAEQPQDDAFRHAALRLVTGLHHSTVRRFFARASRHQALAEDVARLEAVALHWSRLLAWRTDERIRRQQAPYWGENGPTVAEMPDFTSPMREVLAEFEDDRGPAHPIDIGRFIADRPEGLGGRRPAKHHLMRASVDLPYLLAANEHRLRFDLKLAETDLTRGVQVATGFADALGEGLGGGTGRGTDKLPGPTERRLLELLGAAAALIAPASNRPIWEPIIAAGGLADSWVTAFLRAFWQAGLQSPRALTDFVETVDAVFAYAEQSPTWNGAAASEDVDMAIACLDHWGTLRVTGPQRAVLQAVRSRWDPWVRERLTGSRYARALVDFIATDGGQDVAASGLAWLAGREDDPRARPDGQLDRAMAEALASMQARQPGLLRARHGAGPDARRLLAALVSRQNPLALQLNAEAASTPPRR